MEEVIPRGLIGSAIRLSADPEAGTNIARSVIAGIKGCRGRNENPPLS